MLTGDLRQVRLKWTGDGLAFTGGPDGGPTVTFDSDSEQGLSPMQQLLGSLAACMAIDVLVILEKGRVTVESLEVEAVGKRADEPPKRYVALELVYRIGGLGASDRPKLDRAIELSRDKYCSVMHTLAPELPVAIRVEPL